MEKDFQKWHTEKSWLETEKTRPFFHEREVWWCHSGLNVGFEQDGKGEKFTRPVLVFKKFNKEIFWALPLSTKNKIGKFYANIDLGDGVERSVILSQIRLMDGKRLLGKIKTISKKNYIEIQKAFISLSSI